MTQPPSDKYVYFTVAILKDSSALESFRQDALKHHMIDNPGQLLALRLTEYYEMMNNGIVQPVVRMPAIMVEPEVKEKRSPSVPLAMPQVSQASPSAFAPVTPYSVPRLSQTQTNAPGATNNTFIGQLTGKMRALRHESDSIIPASPNVDQNADEAADYWSTL